MQGILAKLEQVQIKNSALNLFKSYLQNRVQITVIDSQKSTVKQVMAGVPQGSRLGPLLWILYYNDILEGLECEVLSSPSSLQSLFLCFVCLCF